jgi:tRNA (guanosine-2'-O-)-methyltransferase
MQDAIERLIDRLGPAAVIDALVPLLSADRMKRIDEVLEARLGSLTAIVEDTYDPHNAAAAVRTTEALGLAEFHAIEPPDGNRFRALKGITRGCDRWIELVRWASVDAAATALRARGFRVVATVPGATETIDTVPIDQPLAVAFGNEHQGLSAAAIAACDGSIAIPMFGFTRSFNLSVSVGVVMARLAERRRAALGAAGDLAADRMLRLRARWYALKIKGAVGVVERVYAETRSSVAPGTQPRDNPGTR